MGHTTDYFLFLRIASVYFESGPQFCIYFGRIQYPVFPWPILVTQNMLSYLIKIFSSKKAILKINFACTFPSKLVLRSINNVCILNDFETWVNVSRTDFTIYLRFKRADFTLNNNFGLDLRNFLQVQDWGSHVPMSDWWKDILNILVTGHCYSFTLTQ